MDDPPPARTVFTPNHEGLRLDQFLATATTLSRRGARRLITDGAVRRNGTVIKVQSRPLTVGDVVEITSPVELAPLPGYIEPELLHIDDWIIVADKPPGVLSQKAQDSPELPFDVMVLIQRGTQTGRRPFLRLFHRLDRVTSGTLLFAASPRATGPLHRAWQGQRVARRYLTVVEGHPAFDATTFDGAIARDPDHAWRFRVSTTGRSAITRVEVVTRGETQGQKWAALACALTSGRTHQIRVPLAAAGHPVAGDRLYGARHAGLAQRPLLHAHSLSLPHPRDGAQITVTAQPPQDLTRYLEPGIEESSGPG